MLVSPLLVSCLTVTPEATLEISPVTSEALCGGADAQTANAVGVAMGGMHAVIWSRMRLGRRAVACSFDAKSALSLERGTSAKAATLPGEMELVTSRYRR